MLDNKYEYLTGGSETLHIEEQHEFYNQFKDFTSLTAWLKCREVKLFFYKKILLLLPKEE